MPRFFYFVDPLYVVIMIPILILVFGAQIMVKSRYRKYSHISNSRRISGAEVARFILDSNDLRHVPVIKIPGELTDNFNPGDGVVYLSEKVYDGRDIAAIGIAAHECGHAVQHSTGYVPVKLRTAIVPICNIGASLSFPLIIIGAALNFFGLVYLGLILFGLTTFFQFVTLPVEFNASRRALKTIRESSMFDSADVAGAKSVLTAAAMTYVAAFAQSLFMLIYYFLRFNGRRR